MNVSCNGTGLRTDLCSGGDKVLRPLRRREKWGGGFMETIPVACSGHPISQMEMVSEDHGIGDW